MHNKELKDALHRLDAEAREKMHQDAQGLNATKTFKHESSPNRGSIYARHNKSVVDEPEAFSKSPARAQGDYKVRTLAPSWPAEIPANASMQTMNNLR